MHPHIMAARTHNAQCSLRDGARELGALFGPSEIVPKVPPVAQKARGNKRDVQILQQQEAIAEILAITVRILGYVGPEPLQEAAALVAQEMLEESAADAVAASIENHLSNTEVTDNPVIEPEGEQGPVITDYSQFDGFEDYVVVVGFTMEGVSNTPDDDRVYDEQLEVGQGLKMLPEDAQTYIDQGLIRLATPEELIPAEHVGIEVPADGTEHVLDTTGDAEATNKITLDEVTPIADLESQPGEADPLIDAAQPSDAEVRAEVSAEVTAITHTDSPVIEPTPKAATAEGALDSAQAQPTKAAEAPKKKKK